MSFTGIFVYRCTSILYRYVKKSFSQSNSVWTTETEKTFDEQKFLFYFHPNETFNWIYWWSNLLIDSLSDISKQFYFKKRTSLQYSHWSFTMWYSHWSFIMWSSHWSFTMWYSHRNRKLHCRNTWDWNKPKNWKYMFIKNTDISNSLNTS